MWFLLIEIKNTISKICLKYIEIFEMLNEIKTNIL
jgi:hypothetical protein